MNPVLMTDILAAACFLGFVVGGVLLARKRTESADARRFRISLFLIYTLAVSFGVGLRQKDLYPFVTWPLVAALFPEGMGAYRVKALDVSGREHAIDNRAWEPISGNELYSWIVNRFTRLDSAGQRRAARYLYGVVSDAAARAHARERVGTFDRLFGPAAAPTFILSPRIWDDPTRVPPLPLTGLRVYREHWDLERRARNPDDYTRQVIYEYRAPP